MIANIAATIRREGAIVDTVLLASAIIDSTAVNSNASCVAIKLKTVVCIAAAL